VPAFNEEKLLAETLASIRVAAEAFRHRGWATELIVCDNSSTDRTAEIAREAGARVVFEPVNQIARARNTGAGKAGGDWLVFVDADSSPSAALFDDMIFFMESGTCIGGGSTVAFDTTNIQAKLWLALWNALSRVARWAAGSFMFCEAAAFREAGGFSTELYAGEEIELSRRLKRLARRTKRRFVILHRHPLRTSDRKVRLYSWRELIFFTLKTVVLGGRTLRKKEDCFVWYDGRR